MSHMPNAFSFGPINNDVWRRMISVLSTTRHARLRISWSSSSSFMLCYPGKGPAPAPQRLSWLFWLTR